MTKPEKKALVPALRFPEFQNVGGWHVDLLGNKRVSKFVKERISLKELHVDNYVSTENLLPDYAGVTKASKLPPSGSFTKYKEGDVLISNIRPYLKKVWAADREGASSNDVIVVRSGETVNSNFLIFLLKNDDFINYVMKGAKGVKMPRGDISSMKDYPVAFPEDEEQQKIADCLSSIDDLITAQTQKLAALKTHKKGLMQQLFPAEGETVPELRFPEFRDGGEWEEKPLKIVFSIFQGFAFSSNDATNEGTRWLKIADVGIQYMNPNTPSHLPASYKDEHKRFLVKLGDYVIALTRPILSHELKIAKVDAIYDNALLNQRVGKLVTDENKDFVYYLLQTSKLIIDIEKNIAGNDPPNLSSQQIGDIVVRVPLKDEQQKIADCLSSVDELITAQSQKIEVLKRHKKGLMQQLFPGMDEVDG